MGKPITNPIFPFPRVAARFFQQTITQLEVTTMTQCIYPKEVYNGYAVVNQKRKEMGMWHSTGEGAHSFAGKIIEAGQAGKVTMAFTFNDYMRFAEMGVGKGTTYEDVQNSKKARYQKKKSFFGCVSARAKKKYEKSVKNLKKCGKKRVFFAKTLDLSRVFVI